MIDGSEPLYQRIAESIQASIPDEWLTAKFEGIFYSDSSVYFGEYTRKADGKPRSLEGTTRDAERAIRELRSKFIESDKPLWGHFCFELQPDGRFNVKLGYDDCDENGDANYDKLKERQRDEVRRKRLTSS